LKEESKPFIKQKLKHMKTKIIFLFAMFLALGIAKAQITNSLGIDPNSIINFDGSYDNFGTNHLFYPNSGEIRLGNREHGNAIETVQYYTMNTHPKLFLLHNNNISLNYYKQNDPANVSGQDSSHRIDIVWDKSNLSASLARVDTQTFGRLNYFTEWFGSAGRTDVQGGASIICQSIYPNIDLVYTSNNAGLVMYFIVYPGGNYNNILMRINGSKSNTIVGNKLKLEANWDETTFQKPHMYQYTINGGVVTPINVCNASWSNFSADTYKIANTTGYNVYLPLIIQIKQSNALSLHTAGLKWSTYFGSSQFDHLIKTRCDASNNLYVAGSSDSPSFPQATGVAAIFSSGWDGVFAKFNISGVHQWSTFLGGSGNEEIHDMDFAGGDVFCVGKTISSNFPYKHKAGASTDSVFGGLPNSGTGWDGFIFQFTFSGNAFQNKWSTYFGGNNHDELNGIKFDGSGNMFVVGMSASTDLPAFGPTGSYTKTFNSSQLSQGGQYIQGDGLIAKFNANTSFNSWRTHYGTDTLGTNSNSFTADYLYGLDIRGTNLYVCGKAGGTNLPNSVNAKIVNGNFDGILAHFTTGGVAGNAKYTDGNTSNYSVKVRGDSVYTVGQTLNNLQPTNSNAYYYNSTYGGNTDGCFSVHPLNLSSTIHNSYLGGSQHDAAYDLQITPNKLILIAGGTNSSNFPTFNLTGPYNSTTSPVSPGFLGDNFVTCLALGNTNLVWSTYLGSPDYNESNFFPVWIGSGDSPGITSMAVTSANGLYVAGVSNSANTFPLDIWYGFPTYFQGSNSQWSITGCCDGTITRIDMSALGEYTLYVGVKDFANTEFVFGFYPNPVSKTLSITNHTIVKDDLRYGVYDMGGRKLLEGNLKGGDKMEIEVSALPQGVYVINVSNGKMTYSNKFVKVAE
jgi:hypothetical protein